MYSAAQIMKIHPIPRFKKPTHTWKEKKVGRQHSKNNHTVNIKEYLQHLAKEQEKETKRIETMEKQMFQDMEDMYGY